MKETYKMEDLLATLFVREAHAIVGFHDTLASPFAHGAAKVGLITLAHGALRAKGLGDSMCGGQPLWP